MTKQTYEAPRLIVIGVFEAATQAAKTGYALDAPFTAGTPGSVLTFS